MKIFDLYKNAIWKHIWGDHVWLIMGYCHWCCTTQRNGTKRPILREPGKACIQPGMNRKSKLVEIMSAHQCPNLVDKPLFQLFQDRVQMNKERLSSSLGNNVLFIYNSRANIILKTPFFYILLNFIIAIRKETLLRFYILQQEMAFSVKCLKTHFLLEFL